MPDSLISAAQIKRCTKCTKMKLLTEFHVSRKTPDGRTEQCARCRNEANAAYKANNRERISGADKDYYEQNRDQVLARQQASYTPEYGRNRYLKHYYRMSPAEFDDRLAAQGGQCASCGTQDSGSRYWQVDHDHSCCPGRRSCGECVCGILCLKCNSASGLLGDDPDRIRALANYVGETRRAN